MIKNNINSNNKFAHMDINQSSKVKGDIYELAVLKEINKFLANGIFPYNKDLVKVFSKKKYKSTAGNEIEVDISLEITRPGAETYSQLVLIECKNYKSPVSTSRYNDLAKKMEYLNAQKGYIFTTSTFQKGVIQQGLMDRIGLVRFKPGHAPIIDAERRSLTSQGIFMKEVTTCDCPDSHFVSIEAKEGYCDFGSFFYRQVFELDEKGIIPYIPNINIEATALKIREIFESSNEVAIRDETLISILTAYQYTISTRAFSNGVLGICSFPTREIIIEDSLEPCSPRWRFTIAHELGHVIIHRHLFKKGVCQIMADSDSTYLTYSSKCRMETQANIFASYLLMPSRSFIDAFIRCRDFLGISKTNYPKIYIDDQKVNKEDYYNVLYILARFFRVSKQVVEIRLLNLGLIIDKRSGFAGSKDKWYLVKGINDLLFKSQESS